MQKKFWHDNECGLGLKYVRSDNGDADWKDVCRLSGGRP